MRLRLAALTACAALAVTALPGEAAGPQIAGDGGDVPVASMDIVSAQFATRGTTAKVGKKTVYTPKSLVVTVTYTGDPTQLPIASQYVTFSLTGCGAVMMQRYDANGTYGTADCLAEGETLSFDAQASGSTVVFTLPFNVIGKQFKRGSVLSELRTATGVADPVVGLGPADITQALVVDSATTTASYRVG